MEKISFLVLSEVVRGGEWIATDRLINILKKKHPNFNFYLLAYGDKNEVSKDNFEKIELISHIHTKISPPFAFIKKITKDFFILRKKISRLSKNKKIDFVLSTDYLMLISAKTAIAHNTKSIFLFHGIRSTLFKSFSDIDRRQITLKLLECLSLFLADKIVAPSDYAKKYILRMLNVFGNENKISVIPNFVPDEFFVAVDQEKIKNLRNKLVLKSRNDIILYSGRISRFKGLENLFDAFLKFSKTHSEKVLVVAYPSTGSDKNLLHNLRQKIKTYNSDKQIKLFPGLTQQEIVILNQMSSVLILPSELEFAPLSIIESLASSTPFVATDLGNAGELLVKLDPNLLLKNNSPKEIERGLDYFFSISEKRALFLKAKSKKIASEFNSDVSIHKFDELIRSFKT